MSINISGGINSQIIKPGGGLFTLASIPGLEFWYRANDGVSSTTAANIYQDLAGTIPADTAYDEIYRWNDISGNGRNATHPGSKPGTIEPTPTAVQVSMRESAPGPHYMTTSASVPIDANTEKFSALLVLQAWSPGAHRQFFGNNEIPSPYTNIGFRTSYTADRFQVNLVSAWGSDELHVRTVDVVIPSGTTKYIFVTWSGSGADDIGGMKIYVNGTSQSLEKGNANSLTGSTASNEDWHINAWPSPGGYAGAKYHELALWRGTEVDATQRGQIDSYVNGLYSIW